MNPSFVPGTQVFHPNTDDPFKIIVQNWIARGQRGGAFLTDEEFEYIESRMEELATLEKAATKAATPEWADKTYTIRRSVQKIRRMLRPVHRLEEDLLQQEALTTAQYETITAQKELIERKDAMIRAMRQPRQSLLAKIEALQAAADKAKAAAPKKPRTRKEKTP